MLLLQMSHLHQDQASMRRSHPSTGLLPDCLLFYPTSAGKILCRFWAVPRKYGVGHAVYSKSDPRAVIFKGFVERLSEEKGLHDEFELYNSVERLAPAVIAKERQMYKGVSVNVDFYSGFVYKMLGLPMELYTPIFAIARMVGWSAHRMEELATNSKIIRPAYKTLCTDQPYVELTERK